MLTKKLSAADRWREMCWNIPDIPPQCILDNVQKAYLSVAEWGASPERVAIERQAASFLVQVWTGTDPRLTEPRLPIVDLIAIAHRGDEKFRRVVATWLMDPQWSRGLGPEVLS